MRHSVAWSSIFEYIVLDMPYHTITQHKALLGARIPDIQKEMRKRKKLQNKTLFHISIYFNCNAS